MDKLSPELMYLIVSYLVSPPPRPQVSFPPQPLPPREHTAQYAAISRNWQFAVETINFSHIKLQSSDLAEFATVFSVPRRRALLRHLELDVILPSYSEARTANFETGKEHRANVAAFDKAVREVLGVLRQWEEETPAASERGGDFFLGIKAHSSMDVGHRPSGVPFGLGIRRSAGRFLTLLEASTDDKFPALPTVRRVSQFALLPSVGRRVHPTAVCQLLSALPNLKKVDLELGEPPMKSLRERKEHRLALAGGLGRLKLPRLASLRIHREAPQPDPFNHSFNCGDLTFGGVDTLNEALRKIAQRCPLRELELSSALVSTELFSDPKVASSGEEEDGEAIWPSLQRMSITASMVAPNGKWYYTGDPDEVEFDRGALDIVSDTTDDDEDEEDGLAYDEEDDEDPEPDWLDEPRDSVLNGTVPTHQWRTRPDPAVFNPLVHAMALAATRAPNLKRLSLQMAMDMSDPIGVAFEYLAAGVPSVDPPDLKPELEEDVKVRRVKTWHGIATGLLLEDDVETLWEK